MKPFVTVIIPCYNDQEGIKQTLNSLSIQDYPIQNWELIVVDNNSTDNSTKTVLRYKKAIPSLRLEREFKQSSYAARNRGISVAKGEIIAFIDSNMKVNSDWIKHGVSDLINHHADYVGCKVNIYYSSSSPTIWERYNRLTGFPIEQYIKRDNYAPTCCLFIRKEILKETGNFNCNLVSGGDREFGKRVKMAGFKMYYSCENIMYHPARSSMKSLINKYIRTSKGHIDLKINFPFFFGDITLFYFIRRAWPFQHFPKAFKNLKYKEVIKMFLVDVIVKIISTTTELFYFIKLLKNKYNIKL